jgi:hypothetical protein
VKLLTFLRKTKNPMLQCPLARLAIETFYALMVLQTYAFSSQL